MAKGRAVSPKKAAGSRRGGKDTHTAALETDLEDVLGMSVDIVDRGGAGGLKIRYATLAQPHELFPGLPPTSSTTRTIGGRATRQRRFGCSPICCSPRPPGATASS